MLAPNVPPEMVTFSIVLPVPPFILSPIPEIDVAVVFAMKMLELPASSIALADPTLYLPPTTRWLLTPFRNNPYSDEMLLLVKLLGPTDFE